MNNFLMSSLVLLTIPFAVFSADNAKSNLAAQFNLPQPNTGEIRIVPVDRTPEGEEVELSVVFPENGALRTSAPIKLQLRDEGFPLGVNSQFQRTRELQNDPEGQSVHFLIDNKHYFPVYDDWIDALDNDVVYFVETIEFDIPFSLDPGMHVIRAFPVRTYYESLKNDGCYAASIFYYKEKTNPKGYNLNQPYLTYNEPLGEFRYIENAPILLDFYITNCELSTDGYKVKVIIDGNTQRVIHQWTPFYIFGLTKGTHKIRLQLLDERNNVVPGPFNDVEETLILN